MELNASMLVLSSLLFIFSVQSILANDGTPSNSRQTVVVLDKTSNIQTFKQSHSELIKILDELGHRVDIRAADDASFKLSKYSDFLYDNILMFCPQLDVFRGSMSTKDMVDFVDSGRNLLLTGSHIPGSITVDLAAEVGFEFKESSVKRDYTNTKLNDIYHIIGDKSMYSSPFTFSGTPMKMLNNELSIEILSNNAPVDDIRPSSSSKFTTNVLIGAMQARNNARVVVSGSTDFYSNKAFEASKSSNRNLSKEILKWLLKEKSLLRYSNVEHRKLNADISSSTDIATKTHFEGYTIMDDLEYKIKIEIYENGKWTPFLADDIQFEFIRIDPFVRQTMKHDPDGTYIARFKVPDVYGVYKMEVDYKRSGLTYLFSSTQVSVRPLRHNEYERFIYSATPYYLSAFLMIAYLYIYSFVYLHSKKK